MKKLIISLLLIFSTFLYGSNGVVDKNTVLDFEDITPTGKSMEIADFYNEKYGIIFNGSAYVGGDKDDTDEGTGNFANEPKPGHTVASFLESDNLTMNVAKGFTNGFSFYYSSIEYDGNVTVYDGLDGTGKILETMQLSALGSDEDGGDPNGSYNKWEVGKVSFDGTAKSVSFAGVANEMGFDKISFDGAPPAAALDVSLELEDITRDTITDFSDAFSDLFIIKFENVKLLSDGSKIENFCNKYSFKVIDENNEDLGAKQTKCTQDPKDFTKVKINFDINFIDGKKNYFENGIVKICDRETGECNPIDDIKNFSVYGTNFNIKHDAFSFENGKWLKALRKLVVTNNIARVTKTIADEYINEEHREELWNNVGWRGEITWRNSVGLCYGMSHVSVAQFNHDITDDSKIWGLGGNIKTEWAKQILEHETELKTKPIPLDTHALYQLNSNNIEVMKKIIYYFSSQAWFHSRKTKGNWIGSYNSWHWMFNISEERKYLMELLKDGKIFTMSLDYKKNKNKISSHAVTVTQLIKYNNNDKWYIYNNNVKDEYQYLIVVNNDYNKFENYLIKDKNANNQYWNIDSIYVEAGVKGDDPLNIYNQNITTNKSVARAKEIARNVTPKSYEYNLFNHISLSLIGGKYISVKEKTTNEVLPLLPIIDNLEEGKAYSYNANIFNNKLYLPNSSIYEVTVQKDASFPFLKLFAKIPNANGEIEIINYENIQSAEDSDTIARFYVGVANTDKSMKRDDGYDYSPDYNQTMPLTITPVKSLQASLLTIGVNLLWVNTQHPNLKNTVIVRKEGSAPLNQTDGTVLYTGLEESYLDDTIDNNKLYYYAAFSISTTDEVSQATSISIDTYKYSIYGKIVDANGASVANLKVTLLNADRSKTITISVTDKNGNYSFNNLTNGTYNVDYQHTFYQSISKEIIVEDKSLSSDLSVVGLPSLFMEANNGLKIGSIETIYWDGKNIENEQINIRLFRNNTWKILFSNIDFSDKSVKWRVTAPADENATLQISLVSDNSVLAEKDVNIGNGSVNYDLNYDGKIDIVDIMQVASKWNSKINDSRYDIVFDFNNDGKIDIVDIMKIVSKWGL